MVDFDTPSVASLREDVVIQSTNYMKFNPACSTERQLLNRFMVLLNEFLFKEWQGSIRILHQYIDVATHSDQRAHMLAV